MASFTELYHGFILRNHITELYHRILLQNYITELYYGIARRKYAAEIYQGYTYIYIHILRQIYHRRTITADILKQVYYGRYITARQMNYGRYTLRQTYYSVYGRRYNLSDTRAYTKQSSKTTSRHTIFVESPLPLPISRLVACPRPHARQKSG